MKKFLFLLTALSVTTGYGTSAQTAPADGNVYSLTEGTKTDYHFKILEKIITAIPPTNITSLIFTPKNLPPHRKFHGGTRTANRKTRPTC